MTQTRKISLLLVGALALSALLSLAIHRRVLGPAAAREEAFDAIASGSLTPDARGVVALPPAWKSASIDQKAYVTGPRGQMQWALFLAEKGAGAQLRGYLFCTRPAAARTTGAMVVRYPSSEGSDVEVTVRRVLNPSCFEVVHERAK